MKRSKRIEGSFLMGGVNKSSKFGVNKIVKAAAPMNSISIISILYFMPTSSGISMIGSHPPTFYRSEEFYPSV